MLWARVIRGMSSMEMSVTPDSARRCAALRQSQRVGEANHGLAVAQQAFVGPQRFALRRQGVDSQQTVGREHVAMLAGQLGAVGGVVFVEESRLPAGACFDNDFYPQLGKCGNQRGDQRHAALTRHKLACDADFHAATVGRKPRHNKGLNTSA